MVREFCSIKAAFSLCSSWATLTLPASLQPQQRMPRFFPSQASKPAVAPAERTPPTLFMVSAKCQLLWKASLTTQSKAASSLPPNHSIIFIFYCVNSSHISLLSSPICLLPIHTSFPNVSIIRLIQESMDPACLVCPEPHAYQIGRYSINHSCHYPFLSGLLLPQPMPNQVQ